MYIFIEQLEVRGKSLQGGANQLLRVRTQHLAISSHKRMLQPANTRIWAGLPLKSQRENSSRDRAAPCTKLGLSTPQGGKGFASHTGCWPC